MRVCVVFGCWLALMVTACSGARQLPPMADRTSFVGKRTQISAELYTMPHGRLHQNDQGLWELYVSGDPLTRGLTNGILTQELLFQQEAAFVDKLHELVPSPFRQRMLRGFLRFFNRRLIDYVPDEYKTEIFGISQSASNTYNYIAPPYQRLLYFHGAHDIGHALRDLALVGCSSFAAWGTHTADGRLLIGRNFDFYVSDAFSSEKVVAFIRPDQGYKHAMVTWAGMVGAVSGMNEKGLTVTINAGKSDLPYKAKTPISLLTREILQYAATIDEAIQIARQREVFVSEAIMVGSAADRKAVVIEVSPKKFGVYEVENNGELLICTNHFQSRPYVTDKNNVRQMEESHSRYRFERMNELIAAAPPLTPEAAASLLRNREGVNGIPLGYGNEKAINQLLAHHAVIFQPEDRLLWVSANPYQLGAFVAYDLKTVFSRMDTMSMSLPLDEASLRIPEDPFMRTDTFASYEVFRQQTRTLGAAVADGVQIDDAVLADFIARNPEFWKAHFLVGEYLRKRGRYNEALRYFRAAIGKEVTTVPDRRLIEKRIKQCERWSK